ncbi:MAG: 4Fe-4S binding protein [Desulfovibrio sp.]|jgi:ferredoxin|nr:4Fe-4S binding protein [Desulfovibrio sp.]
MIRKIITIDENKCNGCGLCAKICHEGAIAMKSDKATLLRDDYCDGLGDCLPACPTGAITFEKREAIPYDEAAVQAHMAEKEKNLLPCGCPGSNAHVHKRIDTVLPENIPTAARKTACQLTQWPVQIKLVPATASCFMDGNLLISADCAAYAYGDFHNEFMKNKVTLIGCPKLDAGDYSEKLTNIFLNNNIVSITVVRMEVPCCSGIVNAVAKAVANCGKEMIPWGVTIISTDGTILDDQRVSVAV